MQTFSVVLVGLVIVLPAAAEEPPWAVGTAEQLRQLATESTGSNRVVPVARVNKPIHVDGATQDWTETRPVRSWPLDAWKTTHSAELRFACDDQALYVAAQVTDASPLVNEHPATAGAALLEGDALRVGVAVGQPVVLTIVYSSLDRRPVVLRESDWQEAAGAKAALTPLPGQGYRLEAALPWTLLGGKPGAPQARLAWQVRWGDRAGRLAALLVQDGLTTRLSGGADGLAMPELWAPIEWLTAQQVRTRRQPPDIGLPTIAYTLPANRYVSLVIDDQNGRRVRNLLAEAPRLAGTRTEFWDGRDDAGKLVAAGTYAWRGVFHAGLAPEYLTAFNNPGQPPYPTDNASSWGADHDLPRDVARAGDRMLLAWNNCEGGSSLIGVNLEGRKLWGWRSDPNMPWDTQALAADDKYIYLAKSGWGWSSRGQHGAGVVRFQLDGSAAPWPKEQGGTYLLMVRDYAPEPKDAALPRLGGLTVRDGVLYLAFTREGVIELRSAETGQLQGSIPCPTPRHLDVDRDGTLVVAAGRQVVRIAPRDRRVSVLSDQFQQPHGIALATDGTIYVSDFAARQIVVLDKTGRELRRIGRPGGRQTAGTWQADGLLHPGGVELDATGRLWCAEMDLAPKRFSIWKPDGTLAKELIGPTYYGCGDSFLDAFDHTVGYSTGTRFKLDYANRTYWPIAVNGRNDRPGALFSSTWSGRFVTVNGKRFYTDEGPRRAPIVFAHEPDRMRALATVGIVKELQDTGLFQNVEAIAKAPPQNWYSWSDRNGDALVQAEEVQIVPGRSQSGLATYWGSLPGDDLSIVLPAGGRYWRFPVTGWTAAGAPIYDLTQAVDFAPQKGEAGYLAQDAEGRLLVRGDPVMAYRADGSIDWTYPSRYAMHGRPGLPAPGRIIEVHRITGLAPLPSEAGGQVFAMNGNNGEWYLMTTDGVYLQKIFRDFRVGGHRGPEYFLPQESFGGHFVRTADDGNYCLLSGNTDARVFRLDGLQTVRRFPASPLAFTPAQFQAAEKRLADETFTSKQAATARVPRAAPAADGLVQDWPDGSLTEWTALNGQAIAVRKAWNDAALYLRWDVNDPTPLVNGGEDPKLLFKYGDSVDLQIAADPQADPQRREPVLGDQRLLIAQAKGRPVAVLYEPLAKDVNQQVAFSSPWRTVNFARVREVTGEVKLRLAKRPGGYRVDAAVPWALLGFKPKPGDTRRGDWGVLFGNDSGELTLLRAYWSNDNTSIVSDVPSEAALEPRQWGTLGFEGGGP